MTRPAPARADLADPGAEPDDWVERAAASLPPLTADEITAVAAILARIDARTASKDADL